MVNWQLTKGIFTRGKSETHNTDHVSQPKGCKKHLPVGAPKCTALQLQHWSPWGVLATPKSCPSTSRISCCGVSPSNKMLAAPELFPSCYHLARPGAAASSEQLGCSGLTHRPLSCLELSKSFKICGVQGRKAAQAEAKASRCSADQKGWGKQGVKWPGGAPNPAPCCSPRTPPLRELLRVNPGQQAQKGWHAGFFIRLLKNTSHISTFHLRISALLWILIN